MSSDYIPLTTLFSAAREPQSIAAYSAGTAVRWSEFRRRVDGVRQELSSRPEQRWALFCESSLAFAAGLFGLLHAGKSVVLPHNLQAAVLENHAGRIEGLIADEAVPLRGLPLINPQHHAARREPAALTTLSGGTVIEMFTSGSSGAPKTVRKTLNNLEAEVTVIERRWGKGVEGCEIHATVSHQHIYGLLFRVLWPLAAGRPFHAERLPFPEQLLTVAEHGRPFALISSPAHLKRMPELIDLSKLQPCCRTIFSSGGRLPETEALRIARCVGQAPVEVFGSTETGGVAWRQITDSSRLEWQVQDEVEIAVDGESRLLVRSPFVSESGPSGWFQMGDAVQPLGSRSFLLGERVDRIVKVEEKRVALPEMEQRLGSHAYIQECAVFLFSEGAAKRWGGRQRLGVAAVLTGAGRDALAGRGKQKVVGELRAHLLQSFEPVVLPRFFRFVEMLPQDAQGKRSARELEQLFVERQPRLPVVEHASQDAPDGHQHAHIRFRVPADLAYFDGHYPVFPVVPGFVLVHWVMWLARENLGVPWTIRAIEALKFSRIVTANETCALDLDWRAGEGRLDFSISGGDNIKRCSGRILVHPGVDSE